MSTVADDVAEASAAPTRADPVSPSLRATLRRGRFWIVTLAVVVVAVIGYNLAGSSGRDTTPFGAANAGPVGARALVEVLRAQGVDVRVATRLDDAASIGSDPATTTLLISDPNLLLDTGRLDRLDGVADDIVLVAPDTALLDRYAPGVAPGGAPDADGSLAAGCALPAATRAATMTASEGSVSTSGDPSAADVVFCFTDGSGRSQIAVSPRPDSDGSTTVIAGTGPFENDGIASAGNASLALGLLGASPTLIWYEPGFDDLLPGTVPPTTAELTPEWVTPLLVLLLAVGLAAAVWRGRRFGPLVVENLPVVVRAGETIEGRARLYRRASARLHALDALRIGTVSRLARLLGLPRSADVDAVCAAAADRLGRPRAEIRALLLDDVPATDSELVAAGHALTDLERRVAATLGER